MPDKKQHNILIVDDDPVSGELLKKRLEMRGFLTSFVTSGKACLEEVNKTDYDTVLLDIIMPEMSGIEVLDKIRETKNTFELPVIMVTSKNETSDVVDAFKRNANDYLTKPVNMDIAMARVLTQLKIKDLIEESLVLKQSATITKMIGTLSHEINNPLAIAVGNISLLEKTMPEEKKLQKANMALDRIIELLKKIKDISNGDIEEVEYSPNHNIFKI